MASGGGRASVGLLLILLAACGGSRATHTSLKVGAEWLDPTPSGSRPAVVFITDQPTGRLTIIRRASGSNPLSPLVDSGGGALRWSRGRASGVDSWAPGSDWNARLSGPVNGSVELDVRHPIDILLRRSDSSLVASVRLGNAGSAKSVSIEW